VQLKEHNDQISSEKQRPADVDITGNKGLAPTAAQAWGFFGFFFSLWMLLNQGPLT
jgi:hypothetical protein